MRVLKDSQQRHCAVLIRSANAAAQLVLRTQTERTAATAATRCGLCDLTL